MRTEASGDPSERKAYAAAWRQYSYRAGTAASGMLLAVGWSVGGEGRHYSGIALFLYLVAGVLSLRLFTWKCPRCARPFFWQILWANPFASHCLHCGLSKWAMGPGGQP
jgi:hypothetical protein